MNTHDRNRAFMNLVGTIQSSGEPSQVYVNGAGWMRAEHAAMLVEARRTGIVPQEVHGPLVHLRDVFLRAVHHDPLLQKDYDQSGLTSHALGDEEGNVSKGEMGS